MPVFVSDDVNESDALDTVPNATPVSRNPPAAMFAVQGEMSERALFRILSNSALRSAKKSVSAPHVLTLEMAMARSSS